MVPQISNYVQEQILLYMRLTSKGEVHEDEPRVPEVIEVLLPGVLIGNMLAGIVDMSTTALITLPAFNSCRAPFDAWPGLASHDYCIKAWPENESVDQSKRFSPRPPIALTYFKPTANRRRDTRQGSSGGYP